MFTLLPRRAATLLVLALSLSLTACDSGGDDPDPIDSTPAAPTFEIASQTYTENGESLLAFAITSNTRVTLSELTITSPLGESAVLDGQNVQLIAGTPYSLGDGYPRISGTWRFRVVGARSPAVTDGAFDVTTTLAVSALTSPAPSN